MSSPTISVLSMASFGSSVSGSRPNLALDSDKSRGECDGEEGGGRVKSNDSGGIAGDVTQRGSVYSSTSYAASRGFRPASGGDHTLSHPVAPPRSRGMVVKPPARGIKKSSSEVMSGQGSAPSRGILKSSSGVLKSQHAEVPLSRSSSGGVATHAQRVNFSSTVVTSDDPPQPAASAPTPSTVAETHSTGMFVAPVTSCVPSAVVMSLSAPGTAEAAVLEAAEPASRSAVAPVVNTSPPPHPPPASSHASVVPVTSSGVTTFLRTSTPLASTPPIAPPRRRRAAARGPTGRTLTRQPEGYDRHQQQQVVRGKAEESALPGHLPRSRPPQQEPQKSASKFGKYPQAADAPVASQPPRRSQHPQPKDSDLLKKQYPQEQQLQQHIKEEEKDATPPQYPLKSQQQQQQLQQQQQQQQRQQQQQQLQQQQQQQEQQQQQRQQQTKEVQEHDPWQVLSKQQHYSDSQDGLPLSTQQGYGEGEQLELLKKEQAKGRQVSSLQKSPTIDIPDLKHQTADDPRNQFYQHLVRAGSLGSGEPAAILEQRRSRSPLRTPGRAHPVSTNTEGKYVSSVTSSSLPETGRGSAVPVGGERKHSLNRNQDVRGYRDVIYSQPSKSVEKHQSRASDATRPIPVVGGAAAADVRTGAIRAAAKAYTENFQSYSFSGYLTKSRKDSVGVKEAPPLRDNTEVEVEVRHPPEVGIRQETEERPLAAGLGSTHPATARGQQSGKIIVPLTSFVLASKSSEPVTNLDKVVIKQPLSGETAVIKVNAPETKEAPVIGNKGSCYKADQEREKGEGDGQDKSSITPLSQPGAVHHPHHQHTKDPPTRTTTRDKHTTKPPNTISRGPATSTPAPLNKKPPKNLPPFISGLRHSHGGDKMKGNNEGALLVACRVGEEDQVLRLLKELTAAGVLDATVLNQADRSGRTALSYACANAFQRVVEVLTGLSGTDINKSDTDGNTPLHFASQAGHTEVVSHLVNKCNRSVDLDARNALGFTPLMKAALQGRTKIAKILLFAGASPHLRDFGRGLCAVEWARYTGRHVCSELIDSVQKSCSSHIRDRWTSDPDLKSHSSTSINTLGHGDNKESWIKHKIKKAFHKSESKKEFSVVTNLSTMAVCATSPLLPTAVASQDLKPHQVIVPHVQVTEVKVPDCYEDPEDALSRLPPPLPPPVLPSEDIPSPSSSTTSSSKSPKKQTPRPASANSSSSASPPSSPPSSPPASSIKTITPAPATSPSKESQTDTSVGETRANGAAKTTSPTKAPFSTTKKKK